MELCNNYNNLFHSVASCLLQMFYHKTFWWWNYSLHIIQIAQRHPIRMRFVPVRHTPIWIILIVLIIMTMYFLVYITYNGHKCTNSVLMVCCKYLKCKFLIMSIPMVSIRLKERNLQVAVIYMSSQLYINIYQSFYPFFLEDTLHMSATAVASIPLAMFIAGFAVSRYDHT